MTKRKPRPRKAARSAPSARRRIGPLWWGAGILALGWIAFDGNRALVERHVPQIASLERMLGGGARPEPPRRDPAPPRAAPSTPAPAPAKPERPTPTAPRAAALRAPAANLSTKPVLPEARPARAVPAPAAPPSVPSRVERAAPAGGGQFVTRSPTPLRRNPSAAAPAWMVLDAGRPLRVTRREGGFARVESGIFTGWVDASVVPDETGPAPSRTVAASPAPPARSTMPTLATAEARRAGPVPAASVPGAAR